MMSAVPTSDTMTTLTIDETVPFSTTHFRTAEELYQRLRVQYEFEESLQKSAEKATRTPYSKLVNV